SAATSAWITSAGEWADVESRSNSPASAQKDFTPQQKSFWAFQPIKDVAPPTVRNKQGVRTPVDAFILAPLEQKGLTPATPASKLTLLRRVTYDLTGLPPPPEELPALP